MTTALYRRYRPDTFADVIGQGHVTEPLMAALRKNRVNHAYLFSGPRGCGKTTSARILARCLNCAQGPTDTPCGVCDSCVELRTGGPGSLDVIEIDAASHGGVDDARDLRERATFAPVRDRYKIFIIDEAHMVTSAGFNALLKIVEEPPEHIKFIFATTEPDKVIGTIRSRTHHYPFRLVPPEPLMAYLQLLSDQEHVKVAPGVLSLVVRAGGGSVRDSLSVLDQLMAGAGEQGLDYELAVSLLGYTHASLLDDVVDALAAADAATVFRAVDRIIQTGLDPRRFVEDLLERFRDLIIVQAMPESAPAILRGMPDDQISRMQNQSAQLGRAELSRAADVSNTALTEMTGATSPRLHLELLCARLLLPGAEQSERGMAARVDRIERRLSYAGTPPADAAPTAAQPAPQREQPASKHSPAAPRSAAPVASAPVASAPVASAPAAAVPATEVPVAAPDSRPAVAEPVRQEPQQPAETEPTTPAAPAASTELDDWGIPMQPRESATPAPIASAPATSTAAPSAPATPTSAPPPVAGPAPAAGPASGNDLGSAQGIEMIRRAWPDVLDQLSKIKRSSWALIAPNSTPQSFTGGALALAFSTDGLAAAFSRGEHAENLRSAIKATLGMDCQISATAGASAPAAFNSTASSEPNPKGLSTPVEPAELSAPDEVPPADDEGGFPEEPPVPEDDPREQIWRRPAEPSAATVPAPTAQPTAASRATPVAEPGWGEISAAPDWISGAADPAAPSAPATPGGSSSAPAETAPSAAEQPEGPGKTSLYQRLSEQAKKAAPEAAPEPETYVEDIPSADDETIEESGLVGRAAVERILGGRLIEERPSSKN